MTSGRATYTIPVPTDEVAAECHRVCTNPLRFLGWGLGPPPPSSLYTSFGVGPRTPSSLYTSFGVGPQTPSSLYTSLGVGWAITLEAAPPPGSKVRMISRLFSTTSQGAPPRDDLKTCCVASVQECFPVATNQSYYSTSHSHRLEPPAATQASKKHAACSRTGRRSQVSI